MASAVSGPCGRCSLTNSSRSASSFKSRVRPYRQHPTRASSSRTPVGVAPLAAGLLPRTLAQVLAAPLHAGRGRSGHRASPEIADVAPRTGPGGCKRLRRGTCACYLGLAAVARAVSVGAVAVDAWASGAAVLELGPSSDATNLRGFGVSRDPSLDHLLRSIYLHGFTRGRAPREGESRTPDRRRSGRRTACGLAR